MRGEMNARFDAVDARLERVDAGMDDLDGEVQALVKRAFGLDRE